LLVREINTGHTTALKQVDSVILATGFKNLGIGEDEELFPSILKDLYPLLDVDAIGCLKTARDYALSPRAAGATLGPIYLNGLCESSHGYGDAGSFSLLSLRAEEIRKSLVLALAQSRGGEYARPQIALNT
jgi:L-ornithine N5-oxygenase